MSRIVTFGIGVVAGFAIAHQVAKTEAGRSFFAQVDKRIDRFADAVNDGFRQRESELSDALDEAKAKLDKLADNA